MARVEVNEGVLEGEILENVLGGVYYSFKGIPYASPPIGDLRFKAPSPPQPWTGVRLARNHGPICHQIDIFSKDIVEGSEDCLYLNVYTPELFPKKPLPVMIYIHGGGYISGSGNSDRLGPDFLVKQEVILVTINYRLEVFGFLCLDTEDVPGNAGMKDQVAALRWIKKNIPYFGGDPDNITIFGESVGAASVTYHLVSPMSKRLFNKAIVQSGCMLNKWAHTSHSRIRAETIARNLGKVTSDDKELYDFFKNLPKEKLIGISVPVTSEEELNMEVALQFSVVSEKQFANSETFFSGDPKDVLRNGIHDNVAIMLGYTSHDGTLSFAAIKDIWNKANYFNEFFTPTPLKKCSPVDKIEIGKSLKDHHFGKQKITKEDLKKFIEFHTLVTIAYDMICWTKICAGFNRNQLYFYEFAAVSERNVFTDNVLKCNLGNGVWCGHCDDLAYLFNMYDAPVNEISKSMKILDTTTKLWTNFAKFSDPTPNNELGVVWPPYDPHNQFYLKIDSELKIGSEPLKNHVDFWDKICQQYLKKKH